MSEVVGYEFDKKSKFDRVADVDTQPFKSGRFVLSWSKNHKTEGTWFVIEMSTKTSLRSDEVIMERWACRESSHIITTIIVSLMEEKEGFEETLELVLPHSSDNNWQLFSDFEDL